MPRPWTFGLLVAAALPNLDMLQANLETQRRLGFLKSDLAATRHADPGALTDTANHFVK